MRILSDTVLECGMLYGTVWNDMVYILVCTNCAEGSMSLLGLLRGMFCTEDVLWYRQRGATW